MKNFKLNWSSPLLLLGFFMVLAIGCQKEITDLNEEALSENQAQQDFQQEIRFMIPTNVAEQGEKQVKSYIQNLSHGQLIAQELESSVAMSCYSSYEYMFRVTNVQCDSNGDINRCGNLYQCQGNSWKLIDYFCNGWEYFGWCPEPEYFDRVYCGDLYDKQFSATNQLKNAALFVQSDLDNNLKNLVELYITNQAAIEAAIADKQVETAYLNFLETNAKLYLQGFSGEKITVEQEHIIATENFLNQLEDKLENEELNTAIQTLRSSLGIAEGMEIKAALNALDDAK